MSQSQNKIAIMRPLLPECDRIVPYLSKIDANRWYSNFGPLSLEFSDRLTELFKLPKGSGVVLSNGASGLTNTLRALDCTPGSYCILPSWTFVGTAAAILAAGVIPFFIDVDENSWALNPKVVAEHCQRLKGKVSAVMVVSPYGAPLDLEVWDSLYEEIGVPIVIDAAAGFDAFSTMAEARPRKCPVMISFHATKPFGIGEGGVVFSTDKDLIFRAREMSNFGFSGTRIAMSPGTNGKMSEYHAAVGLAALDEWRKKRKDWERIKSWYAAAFKQAALPVVVPMLESSWITSTFNLRVMNQSADRIIEQLDLLGVESRQWWGKGCHLHPAYENYPCTPLPNTEKLAESVLALPFRIDMTQEEAEYVVKSLGDIVLGMGKRVAV